MSNFKVGWIYKDQDGDEYFIISKKRSDFYEDNFLYVIPLYFDDPIPEEIILLFSLDGERHIVDLDGTEYLQIKLDINSGRKFEIEK